MQISSLVQERKQTKLLLSDIQSQVQDLEERLFISEKRNQAAAHKASREQKGLTQQID